MIVFEGQLMGNAQKHFWKKSIQLGKKILLAGFAVFLPLIILFAAERNLWFVVPAYCTVCGLSILCLYIPKGQKEKQMLLPQRIYTEDEYIICVTGAGEDHRKIADVKELHIYKEFYDLVFPLGKVSDKFVCQKSLLSEGTLAEFEALFNCEKIQKKT